MVDDAELKRLKEVVAAYGAAPESWPEGERGALEQCASAHAGANFMADARALDGLLDTVPGARMREGLDAAIIAAARSAPRALPDRVAILAPPPAPPRRRAVIGTAGPAALLAASLIGGIWAGSFSSIDALVNGEPLGLAELAPGEAADSSLTTLWETISGEEVFL